MLLIIGFLFMLFIFFGIGLLSRTGLFLIDLPSAFIVIVPLIFFLIASKSGKVIGRYIKTSLTKDYAYTKVELSSLSVATRNTIRFILGVSGVGFLIGLIAIFALIEDRQMLGPNIAVALITVLYSIALSFFVFFPTQAWADNKLSSLGNDA